MKALSYLPDNYKLLIFGSQHPMSIQEFSKCDPYISKLLDMVDELKKQEEINEKDMLTKKEISIVDRILFLGNLDDDEFLDALYCCDFAVLPYMEVNQGGSGIASLVLETKIKSLYSNNKAFAELNKYFPNTFSKFDIGNYVELARKIKNYKEDYTEAIDRALEKYNLENKIVIGFIGTFGQWHGAENIALAFGKLLKKSPEYKNKAKLFMIGDGVRMPIVKKHILEFNLQENVVLTGLIPQEQGAKFLSACDILINATVPNPDGSEFFGSPTKLFEYMAMGKAIICSDMAQMSEILEHGKTAYMVEPGNIDELATAMKELVDDGELKQRLGDSARDEVIQKYTWDKHVDKILKAVGNE